MRKGERRDVWVAFVTLFALIASHALLETARDALFLARVPASRLPWVFLAIAALSFGHGEAERRNDERAELSARAVFGYAERVADHARLLRVSPSAGSARRVRAVRVVGSLGDTRARSFLGAGG